MKFTLEIELDEDEVNHQLSMLSDALRNVASSMSYAKIYKDIRLEEGESGTVDYLDAAAKVVTVGKWEVTESAKTGISQEDAKFFNEARSTFYDSPVLVTFTPTMGDGWFIHMAEQVAKDNAPRPAMVTGTGISVRFHNEDYQYIVDGVHVGYGAWFNALTDFTDNVRKNQNVSA